jgi:hypothetical protein
MHCEIALRSDDAMVRYLGDVWVSRDGGYSWTLIVATAPWKARAHMGMTATSDGRLVRAGAWWGERVGGRVRVRWLKASSRALDLWGDLVASGWMLGRAHCG